MRLDAYYYLRESVAEYLKEPEGTLDFFFNQVYDYLVNEVEPKLPEMKLSGGRDFVFLLQQLDQKLVDSGLAFEWHPYVRPSSRDWLDRTPEHLERQVAFAYANLDDAKLKGLFYFMVLCLIFYGGVLDYEPELFVDDTFSYDVFDMLKPYIVAKKLEKEFSQEELATASMKSVTSDLEPINPAMIPPYVKNSYIQLEDGNFYLVYDVLAGMK